MGLRVDILARDESTHIVKMAPHANQTAAANLYRQRRTFTPRICLRIVLQYSRRRSLRRDTRKPARYPNARTIDRYRGVTQRLGRTRLGQPLIIIYVVGKGRAAGLQRFIPEANEHVQTILDNRCHRLDPSARRI